jgi:serine/threonine protein kinase, bacterial
MPPMPEGPPGGAPQGPHPWESQLGAARRRAEQTELQYLDPSQDPLSRRPRRQPAPRQPPAGYQPQPASPYQQPQPQPRHQEPPQRYEPRRAPAPPRQPRPRNPNRMRIPGLGCLKGCLTVIIVLVVIALLAWNLTDLPQWVAQGRSFWDAATTWINDAWNWINSISDQVGTGGTPAGGAPGAGGPGGP